MTNFFEISRPSKTYRFVLKRGIARGHEIASLQIWLNDLNSAGLTEDGDFGFLTQSAVINWQSKNKLTADGVAGQLTQRSISLAAQHKAEGSLGLPAGLQRGVFEGESGNYVGAVSFSVVGDDEGYDCSIPQWRVLTVLDSASLRVPELTWRDAFGYAAVARSARQFRQRHDEYYPLLPAPERTHRRAWELAVLAHNWPAAARAAAKGDRNFNAWTYVSDDKRYGVDDTAPWIQRASGGRLATAREWCNDYTTRNTAYVASYTN